jgi:transcriptional regulator with XRE-family HTH domain
MAGPPPESQLIRQHRERLGLSVREAARRAGISEGSWRRTEGPGRKTRTAATVAAMAAAVGATPPELEARGRPDAAVILARILTRATEAADPLDELRALVRHAEVLLDKAEQIRKDRDHDATWRAGEALAP